MDYEWDEAKRASNLAFHGVDFAVAALFEWNSALVIEDGRRAYGEARFIATGFIGPRIHVLVWTRREGLCRVISLRKANRREIAHYATHT